MNELKLKQLSVIGNIQVVRVGNTLTKKDKTSSFNIVYVRRTKELEQIRVGLNDSVEKGLLNSNPIGFDTDPKTGVVQDENVLTVIISNALMQSIYNRELATGRKNGVSDDNLKTLFNGLTVQLNVEYNKEGDTYTDQNDDEFAYKTSSLRIRGLGYDEINETESTKAIKFGNVGMCKSSEIAIAQLATMRVNEFATAKKAGFSGAMWNQTDETPSDVIEQAVVGNTKVEPSVETKSKDKVTA